MSKERRLSSAKAKNSKDRTRCTNQQVLQNLMTPICIDKEPSKHHQNIRSAREATIKQDSQQLQVNDMPYSIRGQSSKSKFLQKFQRIRDSRSDINASIQKIKRIQAKKEEQFQNNKKRLYLESKFNTAIQNTTSHELSNQLQSAADGLKKVKGQYHVSTSIRPQSGFLQYVQLPKVSTDDLIFKKQQKDKKQDKQKVDQQIKQTQRNKHITAYWKRENKFVNLIGLQKNERLDFDHPNILAIHGQIQLKGTRFVICDQYKNSSLKNLLEEYGPFNEELGKRYLKRIALGLQHMHYKRRGHNRLTISDILYNKNGELLINPICATSLPLTRQEISKQLHYHAPESIIVKTLSKSMKNDVWAMGCIAILMLTSTGLYKSDFHPYNLSKFSDRESQTMVDNVKQLQTTYFNETKLEEIVYRNNNGKHIELSVCARDLIGSCMGVICSRRPTIQNLLEHQFFEGI